MIEFDWTMERATADQFEPVLVELRIAVERRPLDAHGPDAQALALLEGAGLMLDQQLRTSNPVEQVSLAGRAEPEVLAQAIFRFAQESATGGVLVELATTPAELTEVRGVNGPTVVIADESGARQLSVHAHAIEQALRRAGTEPGTA